MIKNDFECVTVFHWAFSILLILTESALIFNVFRIEWPVLLNHFPSNWQILLRPTFVLALCHIFGLIISLIGHHKKCWQAHMMLILTSLIISIYYPVLLRRSEPSEDRLNDPQEAEYLWFAMGWLWAVTVLHTCFLILVLFVSCLWKNDLMKEPQKRLDTEQIYTTLHPDQIYRNVAYVHRIYIDPSPLK